MATHVATSPGTALGRPPPAHSVDRRSNSWLSATQMNAPRTYSMTNRSARAEATRQPIVEAAAALFLERRYGEVTLAGIAEAAGVSHQTVLNHFESKAGVVAGVVAAMEGQTLAARSDGVEPGDVAGAVHALVGDYERMGD